MHKNDLDIKEYSLNSEYIESKDRNIYTYDICTVNGCNIKIETGFNPFDTDNYVDTISNVLSTAEFVEKAIEYYFESNKSKKSKKLDKNSVN